MERTAKNWKPEFVYGLGDNFYFWGVQDVYDPMWRHTFENVYTSEEMQCDWYMTSGNHDWEFGNISAQISYSQISSRWTYPALHYTVDYELENGTTFRMITIDTPTLSGITIGENKDPEGNPPDKGVADACWIWIEETIKASDKFDYIFVVGHYQTIDARGYWDAALVHRLLPLMKESRVTTYIQGHWHTMEHVQENGFDGEHDIHFITNGAGAYPGFSSHTPCNKVLNFLPVHVHVHITYPFFRMKLFVT